MLKTLNKLWREKKSPQHSKGHVRKSHNSYCIQLWKTEHWIFGPISSSHWIFGPVSSYHSREKLRVGDLPLLDSAMVGWSTMVVGYHKFPYQFQCSWFCAHWSAWTSQLVPGFHTDSWLHVLLTLCVPEGKVSGASNPTILLSHPSVF